MPFEVRPDVDPLVIFSGNRMRKNDNGEKLNMQKLESTKMEYINIIDKQNILYLSDYQKGEKTFQSYLQDTYFVRSQRIPKKGRVLSLTNENFVLCIIDMIRFTDRSAELVREIHQKTDMPILFISGAKLHTRQQEETILAIQCGADEYLDNSKSTEEIAIRVWALIRIQKRVKEEPGIWNCRDIEIVPDKRQIFYNGKEILLTRIEFDIVQFLAEQNGRVVTYKEIYEKVWHCEYLQDDGNIMAHIHRVRQKLERDVKNPMYIQNVYGIGYRFGCCVKQIKNTNRQKTFQKFIPV